MRKEHKLLLCASFLIEIYCVETGTVITEESIQETSSMFMNGEMTFEDLFGHLNYSHLYHPYTFNSGVGNREDLVIDEVQKDLSFRAGKEVINWRKLKLKNSLWLAGIKPHGVSVIKIVGIDIQTYRVEERFLDVPNSNISSVFLFDVWNKKLRSKEPILMVVNHTEGSGRCDNDVLWYRIDGPNIENIWSGPSIRIGKHLTVIRHKHDFNLIFMTLDSLGIELHRLSFSDGKPEISFMQNLVLNHEISSMTVAGENENLFLLVVNEDEEEVIIYKYEPFCPDIPEGRFVQHQKISSKGVSQVTAFKVGNRNYLVLNGREADIYIFDHLGKVNPTRKPSTWKPLGYVYKWIVLNVKTFRDDVIMLAQHDTTVSILTWGGSLNGFVIERQPPCIEVNQKLEKIRDISSDLSCLAQFSWEGATLIDIGHVPTIVFAGESGFSFMYHVICALVPVYNPEWDLLKLEYLLRRIEGKWGFLKNRLESIGVNTGPEPRETRTIVEDMGAAVVNLVDSPISIPQRNLTELQQRLVQIIKSLSSIEYKIKEKEIWIGQNNFDVSVNYNEKEITNKSNQVTISLQGYFKFQKPILVDKLPMKKIPIVTNNKYWNVSGDLMFVTENEEEITNSSEGDGRRPLFLEGENLEPGLIDIRFFGGDNGKADPAGSAPNSPSAPRPYSSWPSQVYYPPVGIEPDIGFRKPKLMTMGAPYETYYGHQWHPYPYPYRG